MFSFALATSLIDPRLFGLAWYLLVLAGLGHLGVRLIGGLEVRRQKGASSGWGLSRLWLISIGPLLVVSTASAIQHGLPIGRIEILETALGGAIFLFARTYLQFNRRQLLLGALMAGFGGLGLSLYELMILDQQRVGIIFQPINFGIACGVVGILLISFLINSRTTPELDGQIDEQRHFSSLPISFTLVGWGACLFAIMALLASGSRGPILGTLVAGLLLAGLSLKNRVSVRLLLGASLAIILAIVAITWRTALDLPHGNQSSLGIRWELLRISLQQILTQPWAGLGVDQAGIFFSQFPDPIRTLNHAHSVPVNVALELGIPGMICWLWSFCSLGIFAYLRYRSHDSDAIIFALIGVLTVFFFCSLFQDTLSHSYTRKLFGFIVPALLILLPPPEQVKP